MLESVNPATGASLATYDTLPREQVFDRLSASEAAYQMWRETAFSDQRALLRKAAAILRDRSDEFARLMAAEMGKVVREGRAEIEKCAWGCEYYADHAEGFLAPERVDTDAAELCRLQSAGHRTGGHALELPLLAGLSFRGAGLDGRNAVLLKHASNVPGCALAIEEVFRQAGFPGQVFGTLLMETSMTGDVIRDPRIAAVTLTGSTAAGRAVAAQAGAALKKTVLELGGSEALRRLGGCRICIGPSRRAWPAG